MIRKLHERGWKALLAWLRNMFIAGLAAALPLILTVWVIGVVAHVVERVSEPILRFAAFWMNVFSGREGEARFTAEDLHVPLIFDLNLVGLIIPIAVIIALGAMATNVIGRRVMAWIDRILSTIPIVSYIYKALKQVIDSFRSFGQNRNFKRVAFIEYPTSGCRLVAFVTGQFYDRQQEKEVTSLFVPTSPNPMTGFLVVVDSERVIDSDLSLEDATKLILSAGLVAPIAPVPAPAPAEAQPAPTVHSSEPSESPDAPPENRPAAVPDPRLPAGLPVAEDGLTEEFDEELDPALAEGFAGDESEPEEHAARPVFRK